DRIDELGRELDDRIDDEVGDGGVGQVDRRHPVFCSAAPGSPARGIAEDIHAGIARAPPFRIWCASLAQAPTPARPQPVRLKRKALEAYRRVVGDDEIAAIRDLAHDIRGARVLELSATATGGGVAELLAT